MKKVSQKMQRTLVVPGHSLLFPTSIIVSPTARNLIREGGFAWSPVEPDYLWIGLVERAGRKNTLDRNHGNGCHP